MKALTYHDDERFLADLVNMVPLRTRDRNGELYDEYLKLSLGTLRRLYGAGWCSATRGMPPDELHHWLLEHPCGRDFAKPGDAVDYILRLARHAMEVGPAHRHRVRHDRYARRLGHLDYYGLRDARARDAGFRSLWHYRRHRGWC